mmetsp:Transcript_83778/g.184091  ORF Transcript_83778/g.184091 Transcript_83778/m.184091 type:complete len:86 (+) Transcript_83778:384-641(+)
MGPEAPLRKGMTRKSCLEQGQNNNRWCLYPEKASSHGLDTSSLTAGAACGPKNRGNAGLVGDNKGQLLSEELKHIGFSGQSWPCR